jgi:hypothetical protein
LRLTKIKMGFAHPRAVTGRVSDKNQNGLSLQAFPCNGRTEGKHEIKKRKKVINFVVI